MHSNDLGGLFLGSLGKSSLASIFLFLLMEYKMGHLSPYLLPWGLEKVSCVTSISDTNLRGSGP